jgi:hypothetical protein
MGAASADDLLSTFVLMTCGTMSKWRTTHSPFTAAVLSPGGSSDRLISLSGSS